MDYDQLTAEARTEMDETIFPVIERKKDSPAKLLQLATDATRILSTGGEIITKVKDTGFFQRIADLLPSSRKTKMLNALQTQMNSMQASMSNLVSKDDLETLRHYAWRAIESLNERNLLTADAVITVKNNLNSLAIDQQNIQENYSIDVIKSLHRALKNAGLDPNKTITLGKLLDDLVAELQEFSQEEYIEITKVELDDGKVPSGTEVSRLLSVPSFVAICWLPFSKQDLESTIGIMQRLYKTPYLESLQTCVKHQIAERNGIDLDTKETLFDLGVELISCYSAIPELIKDPDAVIINVMTKHAMFCPECGAKLDGESVFCPECGTKVE